MREKGTDYEAIITVYSIVRFFDENCAILFENLFSGEKEKTI